jgi:uncharacterized membrane protein
MVATATGRDTPDNRIWRLSALGIFLAALFFAASLTPSLVTRTPFLQGALAGISAAVGYALAALPVWLWRLMLLPEPGQAAQRRWSIALGIASVAVAGIALTQTSAWQNATRRVMDLPPVESGHPFTVAAVALAVFAVLWVVGTAASAVARRTGRLLSRVLPGRTGPLLGFLLTLALVVSLVDGVLVRRIMEAADASFAAAEAFIEPEQERPTDPGLSGSAASLISWEDLGNRGRDFIARTPSPEEISAFTGAPALRPVRVYVGRVAAETPRERAELALAELIRTGGFEREILVIATPPGTGWMDPGAHDPIDFIWGGDIAQVGIQYSYLTSVLSILTNVQYGLDQAETLFDVIYGHWTTLPPETRPKLYIFGLSQGAMNSQATLPFLDVLADPPQGALWAGSPFLSSFWSHVRDNRVPGSPAWRPEFGNGSLVRVLTQSGAVSGDPAPWGPMRFVFLNYPSDPLVEFDFATLWREPPWLSETPRAPDVAPEMGWYPLVTAFQLALDMAAPLGVPGFGHFYIADDYIDAWAALTEPPGWSPARADALRALMATRDPPW